jgi:periplasmic copper chaperone A
MSTLRSFARILTMAAVAFAVAMLGPGPAFAHIDPDPPAIEAGSAAEVAFNVEHGCNNSPTVSLQFKIPPGVTQVRAIAPSGWQGTQDSTSVAFSGGTLDPQTPGVFRIGFKAPSTPGPIGWLIVQKCTVGEIDWFDSTVAGQAEPEHPAAVIKITDGPPTAAELTPPTDAPESSSPSPAVAPSTTLTVRPAGTTRSGHTGVVVLVVGVVACVAVAGGIAFRRRAKTSVSAERAAGTSS